MKDNKRLAVGVVAYNSPSGYVILDVQPFDGGDFGLHPKVTDDGSIILVDPGRPHAYGFEIRGDGEALKRLGAALQKLGRERSGEDSSDADADE